MKNGGELTSIYGHMAGLLTTGSAAIAIATAGVPWLPAAWPRGSYGH